MIGGEERRRAAGRRAAAELAVLVRESVTADVARDVLHLRLGAAPRRLLHRRLLREALEPVLMGARTHVFDLANGDVVAVGPLPSPALEAAARALRRTLDLTEQDALQRLRLPDAAAELLGAAAESLGLMPAVQAEAAPGAALDGAALAGAERDLAQADLERFTIRQTVCRLDPDGAAPEAAWCDLRVDLRALAAAVLPGVTVGLAPGLDARLTRLAGARLLAELARPAAQAAWQPVAMRVAPGEMTAAAFRRFDAALPAGRRREVTLAFSAAEILADPGSFSAARDAARARGYRLALDDAAAGVLEVLAPERLGLDVVAVRWAPDLPAGAPPALARLLAEAPERVVLVGVDRPAAIAWGWEAGVRLFRGPLVERRWRVG